MPAPPKPKVEPTPKFCARAWAWASNQMPVSFGPVATMSHVSASKYLIDALSFLLSLFKFLEIVWSSYQNQQFKVSVSIYAVG